MVHILYQWKNNIKFYGVDTVAPTLDFFYIATDDNGHVIYKYDI